MKVFILLLLSFCYATAIPRSGRIVGGRNAAPGEAPYIIAIKLVWEVIPLPAQTVCSGNILNPRWVLTVRYTISPIFQNS